MSSAGRADGQDPAAVDDRDPVAQLVGLGHVVGREEDRPARDGRLPGEDQLADRASGGDVQAERRLVEEEDPRVVEQAAREVHLLALAGREGADLLLALLVEPDRVDQLVDPVPAVARRQAVELAEHPELLADGQDAVARLLAAGDHVHDPADLLGLADDVEAEDPRRPLGRQEQRRQDLDQRRLAGAVRAEQAEELAGLDLEVDAVEGDDGRSAWPCRRAGCRGRRWRAAGRSRARAASAATAWRRAGRTRANRTRSSPVGRLVDRGVYVRSAVEKGAVIV